MPQEYLNTPIELAARLKLKKNTLAMWRVRKFGPSYIKIGKTILYPENEIQRFIRSHYKTLKLPGG